MRGRLLVASLAPLVLPAFAADNSNKPCTARAGDKYYDLSSLSQKTDYKVQGFGNTAFTLNICKAVQSETWNLKDVKQEDVGGFFKGDHGDLAIGSVTTNLTIQGDQAYIYMTDGSACPEAPVFRMSTAIRFLCDASLFSEGKPQLVAQLPPPGSGATPCTFVFEWRTPLACATVIRTGNVGFIGVFVSIMFVALLVYIVGAVGYNRYALGLRGTEQLPAFNFISIPSIGRFTRNFFDAVQDRVDDMRSSQRGYGGPAQWGSWGPSARSSGGYGRLATDAAEAQNMLSPSAGSDPRFSIDPGEDEEDEDPRRPVVFNDHEQQQQKLRQQAQQAQQSQKVLPPTPQPPASPSPASAAQPQPPAGMDGKGVIRL